MLARPSLGGQRILSASSLFSRIPYDGRFKTSRHNGHILYNYIHLCYVPKIFYQEILTLNILK